MNDFFKDLFVVELSSVLAGPAVGMFFAELGARVIKIENEKTGGDVTRGWRQPGESDKGISAYYAAVNFRKKVIQLDLTTENHRLELYQLVGKADMLISNFGQHTALKLGVSESDLRNFKSDLIFVQLDGFESVDRPAYDVVLQAETGWLSMTGHPDAPPAKLPVALIDILAGHQLKEGALLGIIHKLRTGKGSVIKVNLERASLSALANQATNFLMNGSVAKPMGTQHPNIAPYGDRFETADHRALVLAIGSDAQFQKLCNVLENESLASDPRFINNASRVVNRTELVEILGEMIRNWTLSPLVDILTHSKIPFGEIKTLDAVLNSPAAQKMVLEENMEGKKTRRLSGNAFTISLL